MGGKKKFNPMEFVKKQTRKRKNKKNCQKTSSKESLTKRSMTSLDADIRKSSGTDMQPTCSKYVDLDKRTSSGTDMKPTCSKYLDVDIGKSSESDDCASSISSASIKDLVMSNSEHSINTRSSYKNGLGARSSSMAVIPGWFIDDDDDSDDILEKTFCHAAENSKVVSIARGDLDHSFEQSIFMKDVLSKHMKSEPQPLIPRFIRVEPCRPHVPIGPNLDDFDWDGFKPNLIEKPVKNYAGEPITITGRESTTSSVVDFDDLPKLRPWTPEPTETAHAAADPGPPKYVHYAFREDGFKGKQHAEDELAIYKFNKLFNENVKQPENPFDVPEKDRQTIRQYVRSIAKIETSDGRSKIVRKMDKKDQPLRVRRKIFHGSYPNNSVNEKKLFGKNQEILRYTWKGKLIKLRKYLSDSKNHKHVNKQDKCGRTACHFAASWDCPTTLKEILAIDGVNPNLRDDEGKTPLYKAVEINSFSCVKMLIDHGANPRVKAYDNRSPLDYAIGERADEAVDIIKYLFVEGGLSQERIGEGTVSCLHQLSFANKDLAVAHTAAQLIEAGAFVNATEGTGRTPLMLAAQRDRADLVKVFLRYRADPNHIDMEYNTALHYTARDSTCYQLIKGALRVHGRSVVVDEDRARTATLSRRR